jgi:hypothetical protein
MFGAAKEVKVGCWLERLEELGLGGDEWEGMAEI